jgi:UDP-N-acetylmuramoylalanine--D-glutamate ligase
MAEALAAARRDAVAGDTVALSPGCASFGIFRNEFDRGEQFRAEVRRVAAAAPMKAGSHE